MVKNIPSGIFEVNLVGHQAPELFIPGSKSTAESDIWSLGCLLHEIVSLKKPFASYAEMMGYCQKRNLFVSSYIPLKPSAQYSVTKIIRETLNLDPEIRPGSTVLLDTFKTLNESPGVNADQRNPQVQIIDCSSNSYHSERGSVMESLILNLAQAVESGHQSRSRRSLRASKTVQRKYNTRSNTKKRFKCPIRECSTTFAHERSILVLLLY